MIIAAAQTIPKNSIEENLEDHYALIHHAADHHAELIIFPELSISGYQREEAKKYAFTPDDSRLNGLKDLAVQKRMVIVAGAPLNINNTLHICSFIISPDGSVKYYTKQFLHSGEEHFYSPNSDYNSQIRIKDETFSLAICSDISHAEHPANAAKANCTTYLASIFYTPNGIEEGYAHLKEYAEKYSMNILMSNFGGKSYQFESAGKSAFWTNTGEQKANINGMGNGLVIAKKESGDWSAQLVSIIS